MKNRRVTNLDAVEFDNAWMVMVNYKDVGWDCVDIYCHKQQAAVKMKEMMSEFGMDEIALRKVALNKVNDSRMTDISNKVWFEEAEKFYDYD